MRRWSKLKTKIESLFAPGLDLQIHANVYSVSYKHETYRMPRHWFLLDGEIIFDFPGQFLSLDACEEGSIQYFDEEASTLGRLADEYFDTPRAEILDKTFPEDRWDSPTF